MGGGSGGFGGLDTGEDCGAVEWSADEIFVGVGVETMVGGGGGGVGSSSGRARSVI